VEVERADRATRSLPGLFAAGDQDDRTMKSLDEPRRDDPDHAFVPVRVRDDVAAPATLVLRPLVDLRDRRAQDPVLDTLPLAVHLLEPEREPLRLGGVVGEQQLERLAWVAEPAGGVDPRSEPEPDGALVHDRRIDVRDLHQRA
jgi:hypothetical protein